MFFNSERGPFPRAFDMEEIGGLKPLSSRETTATRLGVGFETLDRELFDPECCYAPLAASGVKWSRCQSGWSRCEKTPGVYDFAWLDRIIDTFLSHGIQPWLGLTFGNRLYSPDAPHPSAVGCPPVCYGPAAVEAWTNFIRTLAVRYRGRVTHFEVWNEPDNPQFWGPGGPCPEEYIELCRITSETLRSVIPEAVVIAGGISRSGFTEDCFRLGIGRYCDIFSYHFYSPYPEFCYENYVGNLKRLIARHAPNMKLWHGESGWPSESKDHYDEWLMIYRSNEEIQAKWLARRIATDFRHEIELFSYYHASDLTLRPYINGEIFATPKFGRCGLLKPEGVPKMACRIMRNFTALFDASLKKEKGLYASLAYDSVRNPLFEGARETFLNAFFDTYSRDGYPFYVYYYPNDLQRSELLTAAVGNTFALQTEKAITEPVLADMMTGRVYRFKSFDAGDSHLRLKAIPLTDYPMVITDRKALQFS